MLKDTPTTTSKRTLVSVVAFECCNEKQMLALAATVAPALEAGLATAILESVRERGIEIADVGEMQESVGTGVAALAGGHRVVVGNAAFFAELGLPLDDVGHWSRRFRQHGEQVLFVSIDGRTAGFLGLIAQTESK